MEPKHCSSKKKKYQHLDERERCKIEALLEGKKNVCEIAEILRRDVSTIYREFKRGTISRIQTDLSEKEQYRANVGQADYVRQGKNKERSLKIGKDKYLEEYIRGKLIILLYLLANFGLIILSIYTFKLRNWVSICAPELQTGIIKWGKYEKK